MGNRDFFDEEFDKVERERQAEQQDERNRQIDDWYAYNQPSDPQESDTKTGSGRKKALYISLICIGLVLAIAFGWMLCAIFSKKKTETRQGILAEVIEQLDDKYYTGIPSEKWTDAVAAAGTAMLQTAGDPYSRLLSPQQYYNYQNQVTTTTASPDKSFGFGTIDSNFGLYVAEVLADSSCYGVLQEGDLMLKMFDMKDEFGNPVNDSVLGEVSEADFTQLEATDAHRLVAATYSARFRILRNSQVYDTIRLERGRIGVQLFSPAYQFNFVEFYFSRACCNISWENQNKAHHNTFELRNLSQLPAQTGYVRISEFSSTGKVNSGDRTAATEFETVLNLFKTSGLKYLVLDLKGNPGGRVDIAADIVGCLITDAYLTSSQSAQVKNGSQLLVSALVPRTKNNTQTYYTTPKYNKYFDAKEGDRCRIILWTDGNSASASELVTGALLDYKTAVHMGTKTYGKGIAQTVEELKYTGTVKTPTGTDTYPWAIYYTFAAFYSPLGWQAGKGIHGVGYTPKDPYNNLETYSQLWTATRAYLNA